MNLKELDSKCVFKDLPHGVQAMFRCIKLECLEIYWHGDWVQNKNEINPDRYYRFRNSKYIACPEEYNSIGVVYSCGDLYYLATFDTSYQVHFEKSVCSIVCKRDIPLHLKAEAVGYARYYTHKESYYWGTLVRDAFLHCIKDDCLWVKRGGWLRARKPLQPDSIYRVRRGLKFGAVCDDSIGHIYRGADYYYVSDGVYSVEKTGAYSYQIGEKVEMTLEEWLSEPKYIVCGAKYES